LYDPEYQNVVFNNFSPKMKLYIYHQVNLKDKYEEQRIMIYLMLNPN